MAKLNFRTMIMECALVKYANEKPSTNEEVYRKPRKYQHGSKRSFKIAGGLGYHRVKLSDCDALTPG